MRGHFRYVRFKTFPMTPRTLQCKVFWALLSNPKHSGVPEDSKSPTLGVLGFTPTLGQSGVATKTHMGTSLNSWKHGISLKKLHIRWMAICVHSFFTKYWTIKIFFCYKGSHHCVQICRNPSLRLATNARACKVAGQNGNLGMKESVREWTLTLPREFPPWELES